MRDDTKYLVQETPKAATLTLVGEHSIVTGIIGKLFSVKR
jgi:hypothetical protein